MSKICEVVHQTCVINIVVNGAVVLIQFIKVGGGDVRRKCGAVDVEMHFHTVW